MGYCIEQIGDNFRIEPGEIPGAFHAAKTLAAAGRFAWVSTKTLLRASTFEEYMREWRWSLELDEETGAITGISFEGEKLGDDDVLFKAIAPHVVPGSYVEMVGEEGDRWRWVFDGVTCHEESATVTYESDLKAELDEMRAELGKLRN